MYLNEYSLTDEKEKLDSQLAIVEINRIQTVFNLKWKEIEGMIKEKLFEEGGSEEEIAEKLEDEKYKVLYSI